MPPKVNDYDPRRRFNDYYPPAIIAVDDEDDEEEEIVQTNLPAIVIPPRRVVEPLSPPSLTHRAFSRLSSITEPGLNHLPAVIGCSIIGFVFSRYLTNSCSYFSHLLGVENTSYNLGVIYNILAGFGMVIVREPFQYTTNISKNIKYVTQQIAALSILTFSNYLFFPTDYDQLRIPIILGVQLLPPPFLFSIGAALFAGFYSRYLGSAWASTLSLSETDVRDLQNISSGIGLFIFDEFDFNNISNIMKSVAKQIVTLSIFTFSNYIIFPTEYTRIHIPTIIRVILWHHVVKIILNPNKFAQLFPAAIPYIKTTFSHLSSWSKPGISSWFYFHSLDLTIYKIFDYLKLDIYRSNSYFFPLVKNNDAAYEMSHFLIHNWESFISLTSHISAITALGIFSLMNEYPDTISKSLKFIAKQIVTLSIFTFLNYKLFNHDLYIPLLIGTQLTLPFLSRCFSLLTNKISNLFHFRPISFSPIQVVASQIAFLNKCFWYSFPLVLCLDLITEKFISQDSFGLEKTFFQNAIINIPTVCGLRIMRHFIDGTPSNLSTSFITKQIATLGLFIFLSSRYPCYPYLDIPTLIGTQLILPFLSF